MRGAVGMDATPNDSPAFLPAATDLPPVHGAPSLELDLTLPVRGTAVLDSPDIESSSDRYAKRFSGPAGRYLLERQAAGIRRLVALTGASRMRVLDVGGGHMQVAPLLSAMGHSVVVHGSAAEALRHVPLRMNGSGPVEMREGPFVPLPAETGEFDLVISMRMIGHFARWRELLGEQCRTSRRFVAVEFAGASGFQRLSGRMFRLKHFIEGDTRRFATYAVEEVGRELARHGFHIVAVERQFVFPLVVHRMLDRPAISKKLEIVMERAGLATRIGNPVILLAART